MDNHSPAIQTKVMQPRNTNLELFRIITMLLIVAHHYVVNSALTVSGGAVLTHPMSPASIFLQLFGAWGKTGINCFVLITGYFMCKSEISIKKFAKLLRRTADSRQQRYHAQPALGENPECTGRIRFPVACASRSLKRYRHLYSLHGNRSGQNPND